MNAPVTLREALATQVLGELDELVQKTEGLRANLDAASAALLKNVATLDDAGDRFRMAVALFNELPRRNCPITWSAARKGC
jgi:hypothetical protein